MINLLWRCHSFLILLWLITDEFSRQYWRSLPKRSIYFDVMHFPADTTHRSFRLTPDCSYLYWRSSPEGFSVSCLNIMYCRPLTFSKKCHSYFYSTFNIILHIDVGSHSCFIFFYFPILKVVLARKCFILYFIKYRGV